METELSMRIIGNYKIKQAKPEENCEICNNVYFGDVLIDGICGRCLRHHYDNTIGLFCTDRPDLIPPQLHGKQILFELK